MVNDMVSMEEKIEKIEKTQKDVKTSMEKFNELIESAKNDSQDEPKDEGCKCETCNAKIEKSVKFCPDCGSSTKTGVFECDECQKEISNKSKFCPECGDAIEPIEISTEKRVDAIEKKIGKKTPSKKAKGQTHNGEDFIPATKTLFETLGRDYLGRASKNKPRTAHTGLGGV
jgi:NADH pyrophosphatase NudC (nudix superfamily)